MSLPSNTVTGTVTAPARALDGGAYAITVNGAEFHTRRRTRVDALHRVGTTVTVRFSYSGYVIGLVVEADTTADTTITVGTRVWELYNDLSGECCNYLGTVQSLGTVNGKPAALVDGYVYLIDDLGTEADTAAL